jgi:hypothetical protein
MPKIKIFNNHCRYTPLSPGYNGTAIRPRRSIYISVGGPHRLLLCLWVPLKYDGDRVDGGKSLHPHRWRAAVNITPRSNATAKKPNMDHKWEVWRRLIRGGGVVVTDILV